MINFAYMTPRFRLRPLLPLLFGILAAVASAAGGGSVRQRFYDAPKSILTTLDSIKRVEMVLYHEAGSTTPSQNGLGGPSRVVDEGDDFIMLTTSEATAMTIVQIPSQGRDSVLMILSDVSLPATDTSVMMYDLDWQTLPAKMQMPSFNDLAMWLTAEGRAHREEVENAVPFITARGRYDSDTRTITFISTITDLIGSQNYIAIEPYLKSSISYRWTGKKWLPVK